jgi:pimeloyl-ACP methyl ester carboxylesterase
MGEVEVNGVRTFYVEHGAGDPVVLVHGLGGTGTDIFKHLIAPLSEQHRVIAYDLRGSGQSDVTPGPYTVDLLADDLDALITAFDLGTVALVGHSLGGGIALHYAATRPERARTVAGIGAVTGLAEQGKQWMETRARTVETDGMAAVAETVATNGLAASFREAHPEEFQELVSLIASNDTAGYAAQCRALVAMDVAARLPDVRCPVLLVCGEHDQASPPSANHANAALIGDVRVVELPDCAHIMPWEKPAELVAEIDALLRDAA